MWQRDTFFRARVVVGGSSIERAWPPTPQGLELILEDASRAGRRAQVELLVPPGVSGEFLSAALTRLGRLTARGVKVRVAEQPFEVEREEHPRDAA